MPEPALSPDAPRQTGGAAAPSGQRTAEVAERLREMIVTGELAPGARVVERRLCAAFGVSRTPLREALKLLAHEGLVELVPNRGARVTIVTAEDGLHLFGVLGALESLAAEDLAERITPDQLAALEAMHAAMLCHFEAGARAPYFEVNSRIHAAVVAWSGNPILRDSYDRLMLRAHRGRYAAIADLPRWRESVEEHETLMAALRAGDPAAAAAVWRRHLVNTGRSVAAMLGAAPAA